MHQNAESYRLVQYDLNSIIFTGTERFENASMRGVILSMHHLRAVAVYCADDTSDITYSAAAAAAAAGINDALDVRMDTIYLPYDALKYADTCLTTLESSYTEARSDTTATVKYYDQHAQHILIVKSRTKNVEPRTNNCGVT